jgi:hypothetical protein
MFDDEKIQNEEELDGYYALITSDCEETDENH